MRAVCRISFTFLWKPTRQWQFFVFVFFFLWGGGGNKNWQKKKMFSRYHDWGPWKTRCKIESFCWLTMKKQFKLMAEKIHDEQMLPDRQQDLYCVIAPFFSAFSFPLVCVLGMWLSSFPSVRTKKHGTLFSHSHWKMQYFKTVTALKCVLITFFGVKYIFIFRIYAQWMHMIFWLQVFAKIFQVSPE